ncbi:MAG: hypothetical protein AAGD92_04400 [Pseudomonadota bacterium]
MRALLFIVLLSAFISTAKAEVKSETDCSSKLEVINENKLRFDGQGIKVEELDRSLFHAAQQCGTSVTVWIFLTKTTDEAVLKKVTDKIAASEAVKFYRVAIYMKSKSNTD